MKRFIILTAIAIILTMAGVASMASAELTEEQQTLVDIETADNGFLLDETNADYSDYYTAANYASTYAMSYAGMSSMGTHGAYYAIQWAGFIVSESLERAGHDDAAAYFPNSDAFDINLNLGDDWLTEQFETLCDCNVDWDLYFSVLTDATASFGDSSFTSTRALMRLIIDPTYAFATLNDLIVSAGGDMFGLSDEISETYGSGLNTSNKTAYGDDYYYEITDHDNTDLFRRLYIPHANNNDPSGTGASILVLSGHMYDDSYGFANWDYIEAAASATNYIFNSASGKSNLSDLSNGVMPQGIDPATIFVNVTRVRGGYNEDIVIGGNNVETGGGDDTIMQSFNASGDSGDDYFSDNTTVNGGSGDDFIYQATTANGDADNDIIIGALNAYGGSGDDYILGEERIADPTPDGNGVVDAGQVVSEYLYGESGNDTIFGNGGYDTVDGGDDDDTLGEIVEDGIVNYIDGGDGDDSLQLVLRNTLDITVELTGSANISLEDSVYEFAFADTTYYRPLAAIKNVETLELEDQSSESASVDTSGLSMDLVYSGDENINTMTSGSGNDILRGGAGDDALDGGDGDDVIDGGGDNDLISGNFGNDLLFPGAGVDSIYGGSGSDTVSYANAEAAVTISLNANTAYQSFTGDTDTLHSIEHVIASDFNDAIDGDDSANSLIGGDGDDTIYGHGGDDILMGGSGHDTLTGGAGADTFIIAAEESSDQTITITDFNPGEGDVITFDTESLGMTIKDDGSIRLGSSTSGYNRQRFFFVSGNGTLFIETNFDQASFVTLEGVTAFDLDTIEYVDSNGVDIGDSAESATHSLVTQNVGDELNHNWSSYQHSDVVQNNPSSDPAVFISAPTFNGSDGGVIRVKNINSDSFNARFQEWDYLNDTHNNAESFDYMALEKGRNTMADGSVWEVGTFNLSGTGTFESIQFSEAFSSAPYLFLTIQTYNGSDAVMVRAKDISTSGFSAALFEQESLMNSGHSAEIIAYVAIQPASGDQGVFDSNMGLVDFQLYSATLSDEGRIIGSHQYWLKEEKSSDSEVAHWNETVHVLEMYGIALIQQVTSNGGDPASIRRQ